VFQNKRWPYVDTGLEIVYKGLGFIRDGEDKAFHIPCFTHLQKDQGPSPLLIIQYDRETERRIDLSSRKDHILSTMPVNIMRVPTTQATVSVQPQVPISLAGRTFFEGPSFQGRSGGSLPRERPHGPPAGQLESYIQRRPVPVWNPQETQQCTQIPKVEITEDSPTKENENLIGVPPITFDGDRSKADQFITQFGLFRIINDKNSVITNPKRRVALALTYIRGPKVDAWVSQQYDALSTKVNHANDALARTTQGGADTDSDEEDLWEDFIAEFKRAFAEPSWEVFAKLENLRMAGNDVEMYIANFENLMRRAECKRESGPMVHYFRQGLPTNLERSIVKRQAIPNTIDEWQSAARKEVERRALMKLYHLAGPEGGDPADAAQTRIGVIRLSRLSEEERARLMMEDRCLECNEKGHLAGDCPDKLGGEDSEESVQD
jgi:Retrotransposon gag protein